MPVRKGSQEYNARLARQMADRQIAYFDKMSRSRSKGSTKESRRAAKETAKRFREKRAMTYRTERGKKSQGEFDRINAAINEIRSMAGSARIARGRNGSSNFSTQFQINLASRTYRNERGEIDEGMNPSIYSKAEVKVFYRITQRIWQSSDGPTDMTQVNRKIMRYFGTDSLQVAMQRALSSKYAQKALSVYARASDTKLTDEQRELYEQAVGEDSSDGDQGSPQYLGYVIEFDPNVGWGEALN